MAVIVNVGDVVLLKGPHITWKDCLMMVEEVRGWGLVGFVMVPGRIEGGMAPLRVANSEVAAVYRKVEG